MTDDWVPKRPPVKFRLMTREGGVLRELGGELTEAPGAVNFILRKALDLGASEAHFLPEPNRLLVRYRLNGELRDVGQYGAEATLDIVGRLKIAAGLRIDRHREPRDGTIEIEYGKRRLSARASCLPTPDGDSILVSFGPADNASK